MKVFFSILPTGDGEDEYGTLLHTINDCLSNCTFIAWSASCQATVGIDSDRYIGIHTWNLSVQLVDAARKIFGLELFRMVMCWSIDLRHIAWVAQHFRLVFSYKAHDLTIFGSQSIPNIQLSRFNFYNCRLSKFLWTWVQSSAPPLKDKNWCAVFRDERCRRVISRRSNGVDGACKSFPVHDRFEFQTKFRWVINYPFIYFWGPIKLSKKCGDIPFKIAQGLYSKLTTNVRISIGFSVMITSSSSKTLRNDFW